MAKQTIQKVTNADVANTVSALDSEKMEIDNCIFIPENLSKNFIFEAAKVPSAQLKALLGTYKERGLISQVIYDLMVKVDRKNFIHDEGFHGPYADMPRPIGWGTTISAPSVHASTLEALKNHLKPGAKCIDIGTGSGYVAACFAEMVGKEGKVYMVDHLQ